jgi:two-component sensor histidine kinase
MKELMAEKDRLLVQKNVLADELQHRVRNNLQLVSGMLSGQLRETVDERGKRGLRAIGRRIFALAEVYERLLGQEMARSMDFSGYLKSLCRNLGEIHADESVELSCECDAVALADSKRRGLGLVRRLVEQIAGTAKLEHRGGTAWIVKFPVNAPNSTAAG